MFECTAYFVYGIVFTVILAVFLAVMGSPGSKRVDDEPEFDGYGHAQYTRKIIKYAQQRDYKIVVYDCRLELDHGSKMLVINPRDNPVVSPEFYRGQS